MQAFQKSNELKPSSKCAEQIANCNRLYIEKQQLDAQREGRSN